jgi:uncharacterized protein DUF1707/uncharacterized protein DUF4190
MSTYISTGPIGSGALSDTMAFPDPAGQLIGTARVSDSERERAVDVLSMAFAEGRLTAQEHEARVERAYRARTSAELLAVSADLPAWPLTTPPTAMPGDAGPGVGADPGRRTNSLAVAALVCSVLPGPPQLAAIVLAVASLRQIRRTGERGTALAGTALLLATVGPVLAVLFVLL